MARRVGTIHRELGWQLEQMEVAGSWHHHLWADPSCSVSPNYQAP